MNSINNSNNVIGEIYFPVHKHMMKAVLNSNLAWTCQDPSVEEYLNKVCVITPSPNRTNDRKSEIHQLYQIAERLGAEVHIVRTVRPLAHATV